MAHEKKTVDMIVGKKVEKSEAQAQPDKIGKGSATPPKGGEVGGRWHWEYVICPWCDAINHCYVSDVQYLWFECWNCHNYFRA